MNKARGLDYEIAARYVGLSPTRFLSLVRNGQIPARIPPGVILPSRGRIPKMILFRLEDLNRFLDELPVFKP